MRRLYGSDDLFPDDRPNAYHAASERQLRHLPRRLHALRPRRLRRRSATGPTATTTRTACRGELELELRLGRRRRRAAEVVPLRKRQAKNFCCLLLLANGTPMLRAGRRVPAHAGRQQQSVQPGQRDELARLGPAATPTRTSSASFKRMIAFRKAHPSLARSRFWRDDVRWYGVGPRDRPVRTIRTASPSPCTAPPNRTPTFTS